MANDFVGAGWSFPLALDRTGGFALVSDEREIEQAKRLIQRNTTYWTDHNVSDPGVTLIEAFAWMTDQLLYRPNRVPDRNYIKFLELIGVHLYPPAAAHAPV